jgi:hypothetical protein
MVAGVLDVEIEQGAAFELVVNSITTDAGTPQSLVGWTLSGQVRDYPQAPDVLAPMTFQVVDAPNGAFVARIAGTVTGAIAVPGRGAPRVATYDILATQNSDGLVRRLLRGNVAITPAVTRV